MPSINGKKKPIQPALLKARIAEQDAEIIALRSALGMNDKLDGDSWGQFAPQRVRDEMAATALFNEKLDAPRALIRLGFELPKIARGEGIVPKLDPIVWVWCEKIFGTPGVKAILAKDTADLSSTKEAILARTQQIALHGSDADATKAVLILGKVGDWFEGDKSAAKAGAANYNVFMNNASATPRAASMATVKAITSGEDIIDADDFLAHEPSVTGVAIADDIAPVTEE